MSKFVNISRYPYRNNLLLYLYRKLMIRLFKQYSFPKFSLANELISHYKLSGMKEFLIRYYVSKMPFEKIWSCKERKIKKDFESFYKEYEGSVWRQAYQSAFEKSYKYKIIYALDSIKKAKFDKESELLDYGCGAGAVASALYKYGYKSISVADIDSATLAFVKVAFKDRFKKIITIRGARPLAKRYDVIIAYDCLEHTFNPYGILRHLIDSLNDKGLLIIYYPKEMPKMTHTVVGQEQREGCMKFLKETLVELDEEMLYTKKRYFGQLNT
ncbi:MAG: class I SAM-dependent methyltransferase [bacterium]